MLFLTGFAIIMLSGVGLILSYVVIWMLGAIFHLPLSAALMGLADGADIPMFPLVQVGINLLVFLCFLIVLRVPLSGFHGAEHKFVHCLELYGRVDAHLARGCPRAHRRCGTTLLVGVLPIPLIALPLLGTSLWPLAPLMVVGGWMVRLPVGAAIQNIFTTREPTDHQLQTALAAADLIVSRWRENPYRRLPLGTRCGSGASRRWSRGSWWLPSLMQWIGAQLPFWLDWTR